MYRLSEITLILTLYLYSVLATCPEPAMIHCKTGSHCTRIRYLCDGDNDCGDNGDEEAAMCKAWKNNDCERGKTKCIRDSTSECVSIVEYCRNPSPTCHSNIDPRICKMLKDEKIQELSSITITQTPATPLALPIFQYEADEMTDEYKEKMDNALKHTDCKKLFTKIGDQCVSAFFVGDLTWLEARTFCQAIGGDLLSIKKDFSNFNDVVQFLRENQMTKDFWIGGMYKNSSHGWQWMDDSDMPIGSPIWAVRYTTDCSLRQLTSEVNNTIRYANDGYCYHYTQAPFKSPQNHCAAMTFEHYYFVTDEDCLAKKSPLCVFEGEHPKQALK